MVAEYQQRGIEEMKELIEKGILRKDIDLSDYEELEGIIHRLHFKMNTMENWEGNDASLTLVIENEDKTQGIYTTVDLSTHAIPESIFDNTIDRLASKQEKSEKIKLTVWTDLRATNINPQGDASYSAYYFKIGE